MIVSVILINCLIGYHINCRHLILFGLRDSLHCHGGSWFNISTFLYPSWNLIKNLFLPETYYTTPVNYLLICLENYSLNNHSNSHTFAFTTVPTWILLPRPQIPSVGGWGRPKKIINNRWFHGQLRSFSGSEFQAYSWFFKSLIKIKKTSKQDHTQTKFPVIH